MRFLIAGALVAGVLALGYVGAKALDLTAPLELPTPPREQSGWTVHQAADFSLRLPDSWQSMAAGRAQLNELRQTNPSSRGTSSGPPSPTIPETSCSSSTAAPYRSGSPPTTIS
jgi:hypothetical protein